jgi:lipopolysaccharide export LptBFGC system permease protein LptF
MRSAPLVVVALNLFSFFLSLSLSFNETLAVSLFFFASVAFLCVYFCRSRKRFTTQKRLAAVSLWHTASFFSKIDRENTQF